MKSVKLRICLVITAISVCLSSTAISQQDTVVLTVALYPGFNVDDTLTHSIFDEFEEAHPGIEVLPIEHNGPVFALPSHDLNLHFEGIDGEFLGVDDYAQHADVLFLFHNALSAEATQAGFFLDLLPLVQSDANLDPQDFFPGVWKSFQWDGGMWALPTAAVPITWIYDPEVFSQIGLATPDFNWSAEAFYEALNRLTQHHQAGFSTFYYDLLVKTLVTQPLYTVDATTFTPNLQTPENIEFLETMRELIEKGAINLGLPETSARDFPLHLDTYQFIRSAKFAGSTIDWQTAPLSGGVIGAQIQSVAVSAGTQYPELSYELAKYLTNHPDIVRSSFGGIPARRSLIPELEESGYFQSYGLDDELYPRFLDHMEQVLPVSEMRFTDYFVSALFAVVFEDKTAASALQEAQVAAENNLRVASEHRIMLNLTVNTPPKLAAFDDTVPSIRFGVGPSSAAISREQWQQLSDLFSELDVHNIDVEVAPIRTLETAPDDFDCFYELFDVSSVLDSSRILDLSPLIHADPSFAADDVISQIWSEMQKKGNKRGYPIAIYPELLWFNPDFFQRPPALLPDWTTEDFRAALDEYMEQDVIAPFLVSNHFDITPFMMLAAAYGGLPFDYRTQPPTLQLNDHVTISAVVAVLDLVRNGALSYSFLESDYVAAGFGSPFIADNFINSGTYLENGYLPAVYPNNSEFTPASYMVGYGYISSSSPYIAECYQWFKLLAQHPQLVQGLPVQQVDVNSVRAEVFATPDIRQVYEDFLAQLNDPTVVIFPGQFGTVGMPNLLIESIWLEKVLKAYVSSGTSIEASFAELQLIISEFRECVSRNANNPQFIECATASDPSLDDPRLPED